MNRRNFLRRSSLALAGGLLVGDAALEAFERLRYRKVFALGGLPERHIFVVSRAVQRDIEASFRARAAEYEEVEIGLLEVQGAVSLHGLPPGISVHWARYEVAPGARRMRSPIINITGART